jgi:hypothetical protein
VNEDFIVAWLRSEMRPDEAMLGHAEAHEDMPNLKCGEDENPAVNDH